MSNAYDHRDTICDDLMNEMHERLKAGGGIQRHGFHDRAKPALEYPDPQPLHIKRSVRQKLKIDGMPK